VASTRVASLATLWDGEMIGCKVAGRPVVLVKLDGRVHAFDDRCPHLGQPLSAGTLEGGVLTCNAHLYSFDARTGVGINPARARLCPYAVTVEGDDVLVDPEAPR
jgi:toluene monooxygenase system ferredoxin subunit